MSSVSETTTERIPAAERREQILAAASRVFGERGYAGATTDQIARSAGISQPYVVRMFGTKENLFLEVLERAQIKLAVAFRAVIAAFPPTDGVPNEGIAGALGAAYVDLIEDRGILLSLMQGFINGHDPVVGPRARVGFLATYRILRDEAGFSPEYVRRFLADGMLMNTLLALQLPEAIDVDPAARELLACAFQSKLDLVIDITAAQKEDA